MRIDSDSLQASGGSMTDPKNNPTKPGARESGTGNKGGMSGQPGKQGQGQDDSWERDEDLGQSGKSGHEKKSDSGSTGTKH